MSHSLLASIRRPTWALSFLVVSAGTLSAQNGTITGQVTDSQTGQPIAAVQVLVTGTNLVTLTQLNGRYTLSNVPAGARVVTAQRIGFRDASQSTAVGVGETATLNFQMTQEALQLNEIIVTGTPGGTQRRAIGNTVTTVGVAEITQQAAITSMQDLLSGRASGIQFTALNGNVGTGSPIQIRGVSSFSGSRVQPLIFVDGIRVNNDASAGPTLGQGGQVSVLDDFNPEDIESVEIIKGPAAATLYGTEASAGVIQIITKRGLTGAPEFTLSVRQGANYFNDPAGRLGTMWTCPTDSAPGPTACRNEEDLVPYNMYEEANRYIREGYFPWPRETLYSTGHSQSYNLDVRGGTDAIRYFMSGGFDSEEGMVWYNTEDVFRMRGNVGVMLSPRFNIDLSTGFVNGKARFEAATVADGGLWQDLVWSNGYFLDRITPFGTPGSDPRLGGFQEHLPSDVAETEATRDYSRFTGAATLSFNSGERRFGNTTLSLSSRAVAGIDRGWDINQNLFPVEDGIVPEHLTQYISTWSARYSETVSGEMTYSRPINTNLTFDYALSATLGLPGGLGFRTSAGAQYYVNQDDRFTNAGNGFASTLSRTINQLAQPQIRTTYSFVENKSLGFFIEEMLSYQDRLFLTAAMRFDDNSTFGLDAPALRYPKLSGTWVVSEENFWSLDAINSLRFRGAWGKAGRQPNALSGLNTYVAIPGPGGTPALRPGNPGNPGIEPEVSTELELGFDIALLDDRLSGEFTRYWKKTENQLLSTAVPSSFGIPGAVDQNLGRIDNWGWEAQLSARVYQGENLSLDLDLGSDHTDNEIVDLGTYPGTANIRIGYPFPNITVNSRVVSAEFDPTAPAAGNFTTAFGERITALCDAGVSLAPEGANPSQYGLMPGGEALSCLTIPGRNLYAGRGFATHTFRVAPRIGLLGNQLQIFALAEGQYGRTNSDNGHSWGHIYNNSKVSRLENDPVWVAGDRMNSTGNDWGKSLYKADFWKLREVGARYTVPASLVRRTGASQAALSVSARNLYTIWVAQKEIYGHPVTDPEYGNPSALGGSGNFYSTPPLASINATLRVTF